MSDEAKQPHIGTLNEKPLHAALKQYMAQPGDRFEVQLGRFVIDIVRDEQLIEIQTASFGSMRRKLKALLPEHPIHVVIPIAAATWIVKPDSRRKSPKRGSIYSIFADLVSNPTVLNDPNFSLEVLLIHQEAVRRFEPKRKRSRRKGWVTAERRLLEVIESRVFRNSADLSTLLPDNLNEPFTTRDLSIATGQPRRVAQQMTYCLRNLNALTIEGKQGNAILYGIGR